MAGVPSVSPIDELPAGDGAQDDAEDEEAEEEVHHLRLGRDLGSHPRRSGVCMRSWSILNTAAGANIASAPVALLSHISLLPSRTLTHHPRYASTTATCVDQAASNLHNSRSA